MSLFINLSVTNKASKEKKGARIIFLKLESSKANEQTADISVVLFGFVFTNEWTPI